jgi:hypothetical protein
MQPLNHIFKVEFKPTATFSQRERKVNEEIQRNIDILNSQGLITLSHSVINKNEKFATVSLSLTKMFGA